MAAASFNDEADAVSDLQDHLGVFVHLPRHIIQASVDFLNLESIKRFFILLSAYPHNVSILALDLSHCLIRNPLHMNED